MEFVIRWGAESWHMLAESSVYVLFGLVVGGLLRVFLSPGTVARHLGRGRFSSVLKASALGIPLPLCSCGVLPAAASLRRQGASRGATTAFLISTPETGVDSIALTWALLGPVMTVARPVAAFLTATVAGVVENLIGKPDDREVVPDMRCPVDACCDGVGCSEEEHRRHHSLGEKLRAGMRFAFGELWADLAGWFMVGTALAGLIGALVPDDVMGRYLGGGVWSMLLMLAVAVPLYICATSSTPVAAMLILKGVSPGTALVLLLAGPATNVTSISVLFGILGKRATAIYLTAISVVSVLCGLGLDALHGWLGLSARAAVGHAAEMVPPWLQAVGAALLLLMSVRPIGASLRARLSGRKQEHEHREGDHAGRAVASPGGAASCPGST